MFITTWKGKYLNPNYRLGVRKVKYLNIITEPVDDMKLRDSLGFFRLKWAFPTMPNDLHSSFKKPYQPLSYIRKRFYLNRDIFCMEIY